MKCDKCDNEIVNKKIGEKSLPYCEECNQIKIDVKIDDYRIILKERGIRAIDLWNEIKPLAYDKNRRHIYNEISLDAKNPRIRRQASRYVEDKILSKIAMKDRVFDNRILAISLISDEKYLVHLALNAKTIDEKLLAVRMVELRKSLIAISDKTDNKRINKIIDRKFSSSIKS